MPTYRVVTLSKSGQFEEEDFADASELRRRWEQTGVEEDSYTLRLHGQPIFQGLVGPMSDGPSVVRYETPDAFAAMTEIWAKQRRPRRRRAAPEA
jgi:hypothetical protein